MADVEVRPGEPIETSMDWGITGLTLRLSILNGDGATVYGPSSTGVTEYPASSGRYEVTVTAGLATAGAYRAWWDNGSTGVGNVAEGDSIQVGGSAYASDRDLCTLADVTGLVPGYESDTDTDTLLQQLIASESRAAHRTTGREIIAIYPAQATRRYDLTDWHARNRRVRIHDATTISTVKVIDYDQTTELETVATTDRVSLPRVREEWQPIDELWFPSGTANPATIRPGLALEVNGTFGWPMVPEDLRMAVAKLTLYRYLESAADQGTALADAVAETGFSPGVAFASGTATIRDYARRPSVA